MQLPQTFTARVIHGEAVGRTIGFPTANLDIEISPEELDPGVYFGECQINDQKQFCLPYFGPRLIFGETKNVFEVYIFDFDQQIYDQEVTVKLIQYMRAPKKVNSLAELQELLENDKRTGKLLTPQFS